MFIKFDISGWILTYFAIQNAFFWDVAICLAFSFFLRTCVEYSLSLALFLALLPIAYDIGEVLAANVSVHTEEMTLVSQMLQMLSSEDDSMIAVLKENNQKIREIRYYPILG